MTADTAPFKRLAQPRSVHPVLSRFTRGDLSINSGSTIGVEFGSSVFFVDEKTIGVQIRDIGGSRETLPTAHLNLTHSSRP